MHGACRLIILAVLASRGGDWAQPQSRSWRGGGEAVHPEDSAAYWIRGGELTPTLVRTEGEHQKKKSY